MFDYDNVGNRQSEKYNHLITPVWDKFYYDNLRRLNQVDYAQSSGFSLHFSDLIMFASNWLDNETPQITKYHHEGHEEREENKPVNPVKTYSVSTSSKDRLLTLAEFGSPSLLSESAESVKSVVPKTETVYDDNGRLSAQIVYDAKGNITLFALYLDNGGKVVITSAYDKSGTLTSNVCTTYDAKGKVVSSENMPLATEIIPTNYEQTTTNILSPSVNSVAKSSVPSVANPDSSLLPGGSILMSAPSGPSSRSQVFTYDHLGNRYQVEEDYGLLVSTDTYIHNSVNQYQTKTTEDAWSGSSQYSMQHDNNGNLSDDGYGNSYDYDYRNRLVSIDDGVTTNAEYVYDALGRRIAKAKDGTTTYFYYDTDNRVIAQYVQEQSQNVQSDRTFVYGNDIGEVLAMFLPQYDVGQEDWDQFLGFCEAWLSTYGQPAYDAAYDHNSDNKIDYQDFAYFAGVWGPFPSNAESHFYYLTDALGSVRGLIGGKFNREEDREFYNYDVYGTPSDFSEVGNPYYFHGQRVVSEEPLIISWFYRDYLPTIGNWMQFEKLGVIPNVSMRINPFSPRNQYKDGANLYQAFHQNPVNNTDKWGLTAKSDKVCCKIKTSSVQGIPSPGANMPVVATSCTQVTIDNPQGGSSRQACKCQYKNQPNVKVYNWHEGECKWCDVYYSRTPDFLGLGTRTPGISHALVNVKCDQGQSWSVQVFPREIGLVAFWPHEVEIQVRGYIEQANYNGGNLAARVSQDVADSWRIALSGQSVIYQFPFRECQQFALRAVNAMSEQCP